MWKSIICQDPRSRTKGQLTRHTDDLKTNMICFQVDVTPIHDEPGMLIPRDLPPIGNASFSAVAAQWVAYLRDDCGLTPAQLGASSWEEVRPSTDGGMAGATLEARRLYYHSLRFVSWSSSRYLAQATRDLEAVLEPGTGQQHCSTDC